MAPVQDLDTPNPLLRSHAHTSCVLEHLDETQARKDYGIIAEIIVSIISFDTSALLLNSYLQPFTNDFPHADIYELISPDLLHQVIKGGFKDHLVAWVGDFLYLEHGEAEAVRILDEIDRRFVISTYLQ
jgi:hypothetical protein